MPRDISGIYTLPAPMPVQPRTIPVTNIFNTVLADVKDALNNIPGGALAPGTVDTTQLADNSVTNAKMADNAINTAELVDGAVTEPKLATDAVTTDKIVDEAVTTDKIQDGAVTNEKIQDQPTFTGPVAGVEGAVGATLELRKAGARFAAVGNTSGVDDRLYVVSDKGAIQLIPNNLGLGIEEFVLLQKGQLRFPATANLSSDPNTLDDYEEGTWTPSFTFATPGNLSVTYSGRDGRYVVMGGVALVTAHVNAVAGGFTHTTASGEFRIGGMPFTSSRYAPGTLGVLRGCSPAAGTYTVGTYMRPNSETVISMMHGTTMTTATSANFPSGGTVEVIAAWVIIL